MNLYEIIPGKLSQSGIVGEVLATKLDMVIDCTHDLDLKSLAVPLYVHVPFYDKPLDLTNDAMLIERLWNVSDFARRVLTDGTVLVHCTAGINRSSLVNGLILIWRKRIGFEDGWTDVVDYIRQRRPGALTNESFAKYLRDNQ